MKTKNKHTPGPWVICHDTEYNRICIDDSNGNRFAPICQISLKDTTDEYLANASLIAAAPEMLEALEYAQECIEKGIKSDDFLWQLDALIKKARGE